MKLRNKKTGEIKEWDFSNWYQAILNPENKEKYECNLNDFISRTAKFREEWEEVKEPLIKDEKIRKAVRAWANANGFHVVRYSSVNNCFCHQGEMLFVEPTWELEQLESLGYRPIAELCGEEE